jgi:hypothetical protein
MAWQDLEAQVRRRKRDYKTQVSQLKGGLKAEHKALPKEQQKVRLRTSTVASCLSTARGVPGSKDRL